MTFTPPLHAPLADLAVISLSGADAATFLHGQVTQDITGLPAGQARLAGYCTAKGRLLASLIVWRSPVQPDTYLALVKADIADSLVKRLSMFVLRAKVRVERLPAKVWGVALALQDSLPAWSVEQNETRTLIGAPLGSDALPRAWQVSDAEVIPPGATTEAWAAHWHVQDIQAGLPWVQAATQELFIPQTLNLDLINGVSFTKGCYPGQEIVARSHYRGTIKRRAAAGYCAVQGDDAWFLPGADVFDARHPDSPWGRVVDIQREQDQAWLLFEAQLGDLAEAELRLGSAQGPAIHRHMLPYAIEEG